MMKRLSKLSIAIILIFIWSSLLYPCTTFCFKHQGEWVFGRNYDWHVENCLIMVNQRGVMKRAALPVNPLTWQSEFGSITFNQYGREFPLGGMNEAGLVIECMWLQQGEYPHVDSRPALSELQWIQYHLDVHSTVAQVIQSDKKIRIDVKQSYPLHFLVCDRQGQAATIEFLSGKMVVHTGKNLPFPALTNNTYGYCEHLFKKYRGDETGQSFQDANYSVKRFIWAARAVKNWTAKAGDKPVDYAFKVLAKAAVDMTMFRVVYDVKNKKIYFRNKSNANIRSINFKAFNFSCKTPVKIFDILPASSGDVTKKFKDYSYQANYQLIKNSSRGTPFLAKRPDQQIQQMARYPEQLRCKK